MLIKSFLAAATLAVALLAAPVGVATASAQEVEAQTALPQRLAIHVDSTDPGVLNMALDNVVNARNYFRAKGIPMQVEIVAYGPGLKMLRADDSPVRDRIARMSAEMPWLRFTACKHTLSEVERSTGAPVMLIDQARTVPSGVARLMELQQMGYAYIRP